MQLWDPSLRKLSKIWEEIYICIDVCVWIYVRLKNIVNHGTSLVAQWIRLCTPSAGGPGSIPGQGTRSHMHAATKSLHATTKEPTGHN